MRKKLFNLLRILISVGLIAFLLSFLNVSQILEIASRIWTERPGYVFIIALGGILFVLLEAFRLQQILKIQEIRIPILRLTRYCFIGMFFNNFMPTTIGGDVSKGFYIARESGKKAEPFVALVVVRIIGAVIMTAICIAALLAGWKLLPYKTAPIIMVAILVIGCLFVLIFFTRRQLAGKFLVVLKPFKSKSLRRNVIEVYRLFHGHQRFPLQIGLAALATAGIEFLVIFLNYMVARALGFNAIRIETFILLIPLIAVATLIPSLNGLGVREGAYIYFFSPLIGPEGAGALSLVMLAMVVLLGLMGGLVFALSGSLAKARPQPFPEEDFPDDAI